MAAEKSSKPAAAAQMLSLQMHMTIDVARMLSDIVDDSQDEIEPHRIVEQPVRLIQDA